MRKVKVKMWKVKVDTQRRQEQASRTQGGDAWEATTARGSPIVDQDYHFGNNYDHYNDNTWKM